MLFSRYRDAEALRQIEAENAARPARADRGHRIGRRRSRHCRARRSPPHRTSPKPSNEAFDYRGDITIRLKSGDRIEGYIFDRDAAAARIRMMVRPDGRKLALSYSEIESVAFTGRDMADGRSWEAWVQEVRRDERPPARAISSSFPKPSIDAAVPVFELECPDRRARREGLRLSRAPRRPRASLAAIPARAHHSQDRRNRAWRAGRVRIGPLHWDAVHTAYERNRLFVDEQTRGPFRAAGFIATSSKTSASMTRLTDRVEFQLPGGPAVNAALGWLVKFGFLGMFRARHATTARFCAER